MTFLIALLATMALNDQLPETARVDNATTQSASVPVTNRFENTTVGGDPNERICVTERTTTSRMGACRICATRAEWATRDDRTRRGMDQITGNGLGNWNRGQNAVGGGR